jgi:phosphoribosyl 1,2-cyclic phosphodiesterase
VKLKFWGVRGSIPAPLSSEAIQRRVSAVVARLRPADLADAQSREAFLAGLPPHLFGTVGGNTTCLSIRTAAGSLFIIDAGSGIRELGASLARSQERIRDYHILFTHFHWDHLQGLPFFAPAGYAAGNRLFLYSPREGLRGILEAQMRPPYFPVGMEAMRAEKHYVRLRKPPLRLGGAEIAWREMKHPGGCVAYKVSEGGRSLIFATDSELSTEDFRRSSENAAFFQDVDVLILDSQYTLGEAIEKYDWGHTSYSMAVDFAAEWGIRTLFLFHHEPSYHDRKIHSLLNSAKWYQARLHARPLEVRLAMEGLEVDI